MKVNCVLISHMKPKFLKETLDSLLAQTRKDDLEVILYDSGKWQGKDDSASLDMASLYSQYSNYIQGPKIDWRFTEEPELVGQTICPFSWVMNKAIPTLTGDYVFILNDDDIIYPNYVELMAGTLDSNPYMDAVYCSENRVEIYKDDSRKLISQINATFLRRGPVFDCSIDYLQVMVKRDIINRLTPPYFEEKMETCSHMDGLFLNRIGIEVPVHPIWQVLCENRRTPISYCTPTIT